MISSWISDGVPLEEIAVLSRVNSTLLPIQIALTEAGIPCSAPLDAKALDRTGVRTALAYLRMGLAPAALRREDVVQTIRRPSRGIARNVAEMVTKRPKTSVADIRRLANALSGRDVAKLEAYADVVDAVSAACRISTAAGLRAIRIHVGLGETMNILDSSRGEADRSTHADDLVALEAVAALHPHAASFESWLLDVLARRPAGGPAVLLSTIHKIKGREWEHVIIYGASQGLFPHRLSDDEEGERRVFHVALTRAIRQVVVLADADECSPFVSELDGSRTHTPIVGIAGVGGTPERALLAGLASSTGTSRDHGRRGTGARAGGRGPRRPGRPTLEVPAEVGLALDYAGHSGTVVDLSESEAVFQVGDARLRVSFGSEVRVRGATVVLTGPGETKGAESALREWRSGAAKRASVPAYVVLNDSELAGIAARQPRTLSELAQCKGIGPNRLDRWGDEMLAALNAEVGD